MLGPDASACPPRAPNGRDPDREIACPRRRMEAQEEVMKTFNAFVVVAFSVALPAAFLWQLAAI